MKLDEANGQYERVRLPDNQHKEIFDYAMQKAKADPLRSIMIGDDPEVDIKGAMNAGIDQVYVNHVEKVIDFKPTFVVTSLRELKEIF